MPLLFSGIPTWLPHSEYARCPRRTRNEYRLIGKVGSHRRCNPTASRSLPQIWRPRLRSTPFLGGERKAEAGVENETPSKNFITSLLDSIAEWQVPHDWFWTFYALSVSLSAFWPGEALWLRGPLYTLVRDHVPLAERTMSFEQVQITWLMLLVQGCRRLYESLVLVDWEEFGADKKQSMMFGGHWLLGLWFYTLTSVAIWVEGTRKTLFLSHIPLSRIRSANHLP